MSRIFPINFTGSVGDDLSLQSATNPESLAEESNRGLYVRIESRCDDTDTRVPPPRNSISKLGYLIKSHPPDIKKAPRGILFISDQHRI